MLCWQVSNATLLSTSDLLVGKTQNIVSSRETPQDNLYRTWWMRSELHQLGVNSTSSFHRGSHTLKIVCKNLQHWRRQTRHDEEEESTIIIIEKESSDIRSLVLFGVKSHDIQHFIIRGHTDVCEKKSEIFCKCLITRCAMGRKVQWHSKGNWNGVLWVSKKVWNQISHPFYLNSHIPVPLLSLQMSDKMKTGIKSYYINSMGRKVTKIPENYS